MLPASQNGDADCARGRDWLGRVVLSEEPEDLADHGREQAAASAAPIIQPQDEAAVETRAYQPERNDERQRCERRQMEPRRHRDERRQREHTRPTRTLVLARGQDQNEQQREQADDRVRPREARVVRVHRVRGEHQRSQRTGPRVEQRPTEPEQRRDRGQPGGQAGSAQTPERRNLAAEHARDQRQARVRAHGVEGAQDLDRRERGHVRRVVLVAVERERADPGEPEPESERQCEDDHEGRGQAGLTGRTHAEAE